MRRPASGMRRLAGGAGRNPRRNGLTLVEVIISAVLLGVGVAGLMSAAGLASRNQHRAEQRSVGLALAQEKMAEVELTGADAWTAARPTQGVEDRGGTGYSWSTEIEQDTTLGRLYRVSVSVTWAAPGGQDSVELETMLNGYGDSTQRLHEEAQKQSESQ